MKKRLISIFMILAMFFSMVPVMAEETTATEATEATKPAGVSVFEEVAAKTAAEMHSLKLSSGALGDPSTGAWARFDNMDFGESGIDTMQVKVGLTSSYSGATVKFYVDEMAGDPFAELTIAATGGWTTLKWQNATLHNGDIYGIHSVYVYYANSGKGNVSAFKMTPMAGAEDDASVPAKLVGSGKEERFKALNALGIISWKEGDTFDPSKDVTAGELVKAGLNFKGNYDSKGANELLERCGLKSSDKITIEKACEILVKLLNRDVLMQDGSTDYYMAAREAEIECEGLSGDNLKWLGAIDLLYTTADVEPVTLRTVGNTPTRNDVEYSIRKNNTLLIEYRDIHKAEGVVTMDSVTGLDKVSDIDDQNVLIDNYIFEIGECNVSGLLGHRVEFYYQAGNNENTLLYIRKSEDNEVKEFTAQQIENYKNHTLTYVDETNRDKKIDIPVSAKIIYNGMVVSKYDESMFNIKNGSIELISNDRDSTVDVVKLWNTTDYFAAGVFDEVLVLKDANGKEIDFQAAGIEYAVLNKSGQPYDYEKIGEDTVCSVAEVTAIDGSFTFYTIYVSKGTVSGYINYYDKKVMKIDEVEYQVSKAFADTQSVTVGSEVMAYLNKYGEIAFTQSESAKDKLGYYVSTWESDGGGERFLRIFTEDGNMAVYKTDDKLTINGTKVDSNFSALYDSSKTDGYNCGLILYTANSQGYVRKMKFAQDNATGNEDQGLYYYLDTAGADYKTGSRSVSGKCILSSNFTYFKIPKDMKSYSDYEVSGLNFSEDESLTMKVYSREQNQLELSIGVEENYVAAAKAPTNPTQIYFVEDSSARVLNEDNELVVKLSYYNGTGKKLLSYPVDIDIFDTAAALKAGDAIKIRVEGGKITYIKTIFKAEDATVVEKAKGGTYPNSTSRIEHGRVVQKQGSIIVLEDLTKTDGSLVNGGEPMNCSGATVYIYEDGEVSIGSLKDIYSSEYYGNGSEVFTYQYYFTVRSILVVVNRLSD